MFQTPLIAIACVLTASVLGATGQYLIKTATERTSVGLLAYFFSPWVLAGMACYLLVMALFTHAFRSGGTVTVLYPVYATTFVWSAVIAQVLFGQPIRPVHVLGMVLLVTGIFCMALGNGGAA